MGMEHWWNYSERGKQRYSKKSFFPVPLSLSQISHSLAWDRTWRPAVTGRRLPRSSLHTLSSSELYLNIRYYRAVNTLCHLCTDKPVTGIIATYCQLHTRTKHVTHYTVTMQGLFLKAEGRMFKAVI